MKEKPDDLHGRIVRLLMDGRAVIENDLTRAIVVSPWMGHYGLAGYILAVEGSPARGIVIVDISDDQMIHIGPKKISRWLFYRGSHWGNKSKAEKNCELILSFLKANGFRLEPGGDSWVPPIKFEQVTA